MQYLVLKTNVVVITGTTLQELDSKKNMEGELGFNARLAARLLENIVKFQARFPMP